MTRLMLRASSAAMTTAAVMLMGVALAAGCPTVPNANGACAGTCPAGENCTPGTVVYSDGTTKDVCFCAPQGPDPAPIDTAP